MATTRKKKRNPTGWRYEDLGYGDRERSRLAYYSRFDRDSMVAQGRPRYAPEPGEDVTVLYFHNSHAQGEAADQFHMTWREFNSVDATQILVAFRARRS